MALGTLYHLFAKSFGWEANSTLWLYNSVESVVMNQAAWAAFAILVANVTLFVRLQAQNIQKRATLIQEERWYYEKGKIMDEHYEHKQKGRSLDMTTNFTSTPENWVPANPDFHSGEAEPFPTSANPNCYSKQTD